MADTTFIDGETLIEASWLNDVNDVVYNPSAAIIPASSIVNTPAGDIAATDVQTALNELDSEKAKIGANSDITSLTGLTTALSATQGGTAQSTYTTGDILYASAANTLSKLPAGTSGQVLTQGATVPSWSTAPVTSVSGTAPVVSSGGSTPAISMAAATASVNGYMTSTYAAKLDGIEAGATVGVPVDVGADGVGCIALMRIHTGGGNLGQASGATVAGSLLLFATLDDGGIYDSGTTVTASGTWRNIGKATNNTSGLLGTYQRIS